MRYEKLEPLPEGTKATVRSPGTLGLPQGTELTYVGLSPQKAYWMFKSKVFPDNVPYALYPSEVDLIDVPNDTGTQETIATDPVTGGQKGVKRERYSLIPVEPMAEVARVYGDGAQKYSANNWRLGYSWSWSLDALGRHIEDFRRGNTKDKDSGLHPLAHAVFHLLTLMEYDMKELGTDDRGDVQGSSA